MENASGRVEVHDENVHFEQFKGTAAGGKLEFDLSRIGIVSHERTVSEVYALASTRGNFLPCRYSRLRLRSFSFIRESVAASGGVTNEVAGSPRCFRIRQNLHVDRAIDEEANRPRGRYLNGNEEASHLHRRSHHGRFVVEPVGRLGMKPHQRPSRRGRRSISRPQAISPDESELIVPKTRQPYAMTSTWSSCRACGKARSSDSSSSSHGAWRGNHTVPFEMRRGCQGPELL